MLRFLMGMVLGALLGAGGLLIYQEMKRIEGPKVAKTAPDAGVAPEKAPAKKKRRGGTASSSAPETAPTDTPVRQLTDAEKVSRSEGDELTAAPTTIDLGADQPEPRALERKEIDAALSARADDIITCITTARGDTNFTGRVIAGVVVAADGRVTKSRVEAARYLIDHGLANCVRRHLASLKFPATGRETVVTVPFDVTD